MHLKIFQVFPSLCQLEVHFRHWQCHQRAGAIRGSSNINQNTNITKHEVKHQNTVYINIENGLTGLQK